MNQKPTTIQAIKETIEHCKTRIALENMTIDALERDLKKLTDQETGPGKVDRLFCRTYEIDTVGGYPTHPIPVHE